MGKKPDGSLNPKQQLFVQHYIKCLNATQSYKAAYNTEKDTVAATEGGKLLRKPEIMAAIEAGRAEIKKKLDIDQEWIVSRLKAVADGHIGKVAEFQGQTLKLKDSKELTNDDLRSLSSIKTKSSSTPMGDSFEFSVTVKDNVKALELLGKHIGMWTDKGNGEGNEYRASVDGRIDDLFGKFKGTGSK